MHKDVVEKLLVNSRPIDWSYLSSETASPLIKVLPTPPDVRWTSLTLNTTSMYVCTLIFLPVHLYASLHVWVQALIHTSDACVWVFPCMNAAVWTCQSLSPAEPVCSPSLCTLWPHGLRRDMQPICQERLKKKKIHIRRWRAASQATLRRVFVGLTER